MARETLKPGMRLGPYAIVELLGQGGMGQVFRARDTRLDREVAIKVLRGDRGDRRSDERFAREIEAASRVAHPNIVCVHAGGEEHGVPFLVTDLVTGEGLDAVVARGGALALLRVAELGAKLASALVALHEAGVLHRDLKPANVLLDEAGEPRLTDFGLAKLDGASTLTKTGQLLGTPVYAPLEQLEGGHVDERTDIYALGATLYELATGEPPFPTDDVLGTVTAKLRLPAPPSSLRADGDTLLDPVCLGCLAPAPDDRFESAAELLAALERALAGEEPPPPRRWPLLAASALAILLAGGAIGVVLRGERPAGPAPVDADRALRDAVSARRAAARSLEELDLSDLVAPPPAPGPGAVAAWTWHGLSSLARGDLAAANGAASALAPGLDGDPSPAGAALRGGLAVAVSADARRAVQELDRAIAGGVDSPAIRIWRLRALLRRGGDRVPAASEVVAELERLRHHDLPRGARAAELETEALVVLGRREPARAALAQLDEPRPDLAWAVALLGVDEALARGDFKGALEASREAARSGPPDAGSTKRVQRILSLIDAPISRIGDGVASAAEQAVLEAALTLLARVAPGERLPRRQAERLGQSVAIAATGLTFALLIAVAEVSEDEDDLVFQAAITSLQRGNSKDPRIAAIARRVAAHGTTPERRLAGTAALVHAMLLEERFDEAIRAADEALAATASLVAKGELAAEDAKQSRAEMVFTKGMAARRLGRHEEALRIFASDPFIGAIRPSELASERIATLQEARKPEEAFAFALEVLRDPPGVGPRKALAEQVWRLGASLGRQGELEPLVQALELWRLGDDDAYWNVRFALVAALRGQSDRAVARLKRARLLASIDARFDSVESLLASGDRTGLALLRELEHEPGLGTPEGGRTPGR